MRPDAAASSIVAGTCPEPSPVGTVEDMRAHVTKKRLLYALAVLVAVAVTAAAILLTLPDGSSGAGGGANTPASPSSAEATSASASLRTAVGVTTLSTTEYLSAVAGPPGATKAFVNDATSVTAAALPDGRTVATRYLPAQLDTILDTYTKAGTDVTGAGRPATGSGGSGAAIGLTTLTIGIAIVVAIVLWLSLARRSASSSSPSGRAGDRHHQALGQVPDTRFDDVAGADEAVAEMGEVVDFLTNPEKYTHLGAETPAGVLLSGPPGTGKTLLARAVAGEAGVPFFAASGSDFVDTYVGVGARRVRELFDQARKHPAAIIFIDEIDAIGASREPGPGESSNREHNQTLNQLLVEMAGFHSHRIIVIGATNLDSRLDAALTRSGRLEKKIVVPLPDRRGRARILATHAQRRRMGDDVDLDAVAGRTAGFSGADLARLINEAAIAAATAGDDHVTSSHLDAAIALVVMGRARTSAVMTEHDRRLTAFHEAGHTVAALCHPDAHDPVEVSIIPRGAAGGVTWYGAGDDAYLTRRQAHARLAVALAGRAGEEICLDGEFTSGPHSDLSHATDTALAMVGQYGMTGRGLMIRSSGLLATGSAITDTTVEEVEELLSDALEVARALLADNRALFDAVVDGLLTYDTLNAAELAALRSSATLTRPPRMAPPPAGIRPRPAPVAAVAPKAPARPRRRAGALVAAAAARLAGSRKTSASA